MNQTSVVSFVLRPSPYTGCALVALHLATLLPLWLGQPPASMPSIALAFVATMLIALHGAWAAWRFGWLRSRRSVLSLRLGPAQGCSLVRADGSRVDGTVHSSTIVSGSLVVVAVRRQRERAAPAAALTHFVSHLVIVPDMLDADAFRRLRIMLKWGTGGSISGSARAAAAATNGALLSRAD